MKCTSIVLARGCGVQGLEGGRGGTARALSGTRWRALLFEET